jgi:hypothetical protein
LSSKHDAITRRDICDENSGLNHDAITSSLTTHISAHHASVRWYLSFEAVIATLLSMVMLAFSMQGPADTFWARFLDLTASGPDLLTAVCQRLSSVERQALHGVNRAMRVAMNATVTSIRCSQLTLPTHQQLHEVFPNLLSQDLRVAGYWVDGWRVPLQQLAGSSGPLLTKLRHLSVTVRPANMTDAADIQVILKLLARCAGQVHA